MPRICVQNNQFINSNIANNVNKTITTTVSQQLMYDILNEIIKQKQNNNNNKTTIKHKLLDPIYNTNIRTKRRKLI